MRQRTGSKAAAVIGAVLALAISMIAFSGPAAQADVPASPAASEFTAPLCAGQTDYSPTQNTGTPVVDMTRVFGERLTAYNAGGVVPLYDSYGGSALLDATGTVVGDAAYPPICGTRYVTSAGGAVSEWMFCTDRMAQSCGDTNGNGQLVDHDGNPIAAMTDLSRNPRLSADQEKIIAYLIQAGHSYQGVGDQAWGGVEEARSDLTTNARNALQTLIWCVSDPASTASDFATTCEANMDADEQARLLTMIPDAPALGIALSSPGASVGVGDSATFNFTTNIYNQPIQLAVGGTAAATVSVCSGPATLSAGVLTVTNSDPSDSTAIELCAVATTAGTVTLNASATPPSTTHIGWSQSMNLALAEPCQVYGTFHEVQQLKVSATGDLRVEAASTPADPTTGAKLQGAELAPTGAPLDMAVLWLGLGLLGLGGTATLLRFRRTRRHD